MKQRRKHHSIRLQGWNYGSRAWYFLTFTTYQRETLLGTFANGGVELSTYGQIVLEEWERSKTIRPTMKFDCIAIMPDHVHMLVYMRHTERYVKEELTPNTLTRKRRSISSFLGQLKATCTTRIQRTHTEKVWQRGFHDQIVRNQEHLFNIRQYIKNNPRHGYLKSRL